MGANDKDRHRPWLAYALEESLGRSLLAPRDVIDYANPEVLVRVQDGIFWSTPDILEEGEEHDRLYALLVEDRAWYADYQKRTDRTDRMRTSGSLARSTAALPPNTASGSSMWK